MSPPHPRRALAAVIVMSALVLGACGGDEPGTARPGPEATSAGAGAPTTTAGAGPDLRTIAVAVEGGSTVGGSSTERVDLGAQVRIEVTADVADHVHVHTYDVLSDVAPGSPAVLELTADIPGVHEVELEESGLLLFELQVEP